MVKSSHSLEEGIQLLENAKDFASYVVTKYPQVNEKGELNYYLSGSLLMMLLSQAQYFELLDSSKIPEIKIAERRQIPLDLSDKLKQFARKIGDLDYVETSAYKKAKSELPDEYVEPEKYAEEKSKFLPFGGESFSLTDFSKSSREILFQSLNSDKIICDSPKIYGEMEIAKIRLGNKDYFITDPLNFFGCKFLSILQKFPKKADSLKRDFNVLLPVFSELYSEQDLIKSTYELIDNFQNANLKQPTLIKDCFKKVKRNLFFNFDSESRTLKSFLHKLKKYDLLQERIL